jgi:putative transposase
LEAIKGGRVLAELAGKYEIHPTQIAKWKKEAVEGVIATFSDKRGRKAKDDEALKARLYQQIGQLQVELDWLKKKFGVDD